MIPGATNAIQTASSKFEEILLGPEISRFKFMSIDFINNQMLGKSAFEIFLYSPTYRDLLLQDYRALPVNASDALVAAEVSDSLFSMHGIPARMAYSPLAQIEAWEYVLSLMVEDDPVRYERLHKGTPFYFVGMAAYTLRDFEKAVFYMDSALDQDLRLHGNKWPDVPSGKFVLLDDTSQYQAARVLVTRTRQIFEEIVAEVARKGGVGLSLDELRDKLVRPAMTMNSLKRSAVTAFMSFLLEFASRTTDLRLAGSPTSTGEPFFLHLFKGALLFETLLKTSAAGATIQAKNLKATINNLLQDATIYSAFGFGTAPQGFGVHTFDDVVNAIAADSTPDYTQRAVRATWGIRNTTGHSIAWRYRPDPAEYKNLFQLIITAVTATLANLHS